MPKNWFLEGLLAAVILLSTAPQVAAADYSVGLDTKIAGSHNDNIRLVEHNKTSVRKYEVAPTLDLSINTETTKLELDSTFSFKRYDKSQYNSDDQSVSLTLSRQLERGNYGINARVVRDSTITSELLTTGVVGETAQRTEHYELTPNWAYSLNENNFLQLYATYTTQKYHSSSYIGYDNISGEADWIYLFSERVKLISTLSYATYHSDDVKFGVPTTGFPYQSNDPNAPGIPILPGIYYLPAKQFGEQSYSTRTKTKGIQLGADYKLTEQSMLSARFGRSRRDTTYPINDRDNVCSNPDYLLLIQAGLEPFVGGVCTSIPHDVNLSSTYQLDWSWRNERQKFTLNGSKATQPTSAGYTVDSLQVGSNWYYQLTELSRVSIALTYVRNRASGLNTAPQNVSYADRYYGKATLGYQYRFTENWFLNANFAFSEQKYTSANYRASSREFSVGIRYQPDQWHWAR